MAIDMNADMDAVRSSKDLTQKHCVACEGGMPALNPAHVPNYMKYAPGWTASPDAKKIARDFEFKDFKESMAFINKVADIAESEGHHPDIDIFYNKVHLDLSTHAVEGLSENDFILAAKINEI